MLNGFNRFRGYGISNLAFTADGKGLACGTGYVYWTDYVLLGPRRAARFGNGLCLLPGAAFWEMPPAANAAASYLRRPACDWSAR